MLEKGRSPEPRSECRGKGRSSGRTVRTVDYLRCKSLATCELRTLDEVTRTFKDDSERPWLAERVGRTSGIVGRDGKSTLPGPSDIIRFTCQSDPDEKMREATIKAGSLGELTDEELQTELQTARVLFRA